MALLFSSSTPQSIKDKKLYDDDSKFTNDDLQDVLDGLLKLRVSNVSNNNKKRIRPVQVTTVINKKKAVKHHAPSNTNAHCPNRHNPAYQQEPTFIASSRILRPKHSSPPLSGINLLFEAAKEVEGRANFLMDVSKIDTTKSAMRFEDIRDQITYNKESGVMKKKSLNGISPPQRVAFKKEHNDESLLPEMPSFGTQPKEEEQREHRRISREWSNRNIQEMDRMYDDKSKLAQKLQFDSESGSSAVNNLKHLTNSSVLICREFSESNHELGSVINEHKDNMDKIRAYHEKHRCSVRRQQNEMLKAQLAEMEEKIMKQQRREKEIAKREEEEKRQREAEKSKAEAQQEAKQKEAQQKEQQKEAQQKEQQKEAQVAAKLDEKKKELKKEWYRNEEPLCNMYKHYKTMYKQCEDLIENAEQQLMNRNDNLEMKIGLILPAIRANQKSVFDAFKRFERIVNERKDRMERSYALTKMTKLIISDVSLIKSSAQKFASAYFLSFIMNEYREEYLNIFKCMFYGECLWTVPYIDKQLRSFNPDKPSIVRCVVLKYRNVKDINDVPSEKRQYLQQFTKENNAGTVVFEAEKTYFDRIQAICGLFAAFMSIRNNNTFSNPFGIDSSDCWKWIAHLLCLPQCVYPEVCSILSSIIQIVGHEMLEKYPNQFPKIIAFIRNNIFSKCDESTTTRSKARRELNLLLRDCKNNGQIVINKPAESKLIAKTVGASALTNVRE